MEARRDGDLVRDPVRALVVAGILLAAFEIFVALVAVEHARPPLLDGIDRSWRDLALRAPAWAERASEILRTLGSGIVMVPIRVAVAVWLLVRRRRLDVAAWLLGWALADAIAIALKPAIGRSHPDGVEATSFPSAHAKTAAQVAIGLVLVATSPAGRRRAGWWVLAVAWVVAMAASRTLLDEHWLSDVLAGSLLGAGCAVGSAALVQRFLSSRRARSSRPDGATGTREPCGRSRPRFSVPIPHSVFELPPPPLPATPSPPPARRGLRALIIGLAVLLNLALVAALVFSSATTERPAGRNAYSFMAVSSGGTPFRWDPCSPIRYQVDLAGMPESVLDDVHEAVRLTADASGLRFEYRGLVERTSPLDLIETLDFVSSAADGPLGWSPVLITFGSQEVFDRMGAPREAAGVGMPVTSRYDPDQFVSGLIVINADLPLASGFEHVASLGPVVEHELGHVVGLGHVLHPGQLMFPAPIVRRWNDGDLTGLRRLGSGPCLVVPSAFPNAATLVPPR